MNHVNTEALTELADNGQDLTELLRPLLTLALTDTENLISALANAELSEDAAERVQEEIDFIASEMEHTLPARENVYELEGQRYDLGAILSIRAEQKVVR